MKNLKFVVCILVFYFIPHIIYCFVENINRINTKEYDYLIIVADKFYNDISRFADWKIRKGFSTKVIKLSSIGKEWKEIKNFVKHEYEKNNIKFILLVGDVENIPFVYQHTNYSSDIRYGDLDGNVFNLEVPVGRIIPSKKIMCYQIFEDVNYAIDKLINYEIQLPADDIINNVLLISHQNKIYNSCSNSIFNKEYINPPKFIKVFGAESGCNEDINTFLSSGVNIVNYRGHAGATGWDSWSNIGESFSGSELNKISYQPWNPIVFSIACFTAALEMEDLTIAEEFVMNKYGAVAFLGATGTTENTMNNIFNKKLFSSIYNQNIFLLGNIIKNSMNDYSLESCFDRYKYLLIGDPALEIWTNKSQKFTNVKLIDNKNNLIIKTSIDSCKVCVSSTMSGKEFYKVITGNPPFEINTSVRPLYVTLTKHNYVPFTLITGGKIISNENWIGNLMIQGDLTISKNTKINISNGSPVIEGSLTIEDGVKLNFDKDLQLIVKGNLIASGINSNVISFKSINEKNKWGGIVFDSSSNGILENCEIQNAITGINCKKTLPKICNNSLYKNNTAINVFDINNLDNSISCNNIFANKQKGIYINNSFIKIERNNIYDNDVGIDCFHSNVFLYKNLLKKNSTYGLKSSYYSSIYMLSSNFLSSYSKTGENILMNNNCEIMSEYYCNLYLGTMKYVGLNTFSNEINNCEINANYNCFIKAELNNWGTDPKFNIFNSYFDNLPIWDGFSNNQNITDNDENNFNLICNTNSNLEKALKYQQDGFYNDAILIYQNYIKKNITSPQAANVLTRHKRLSLHFR